LGKETRISFSVTLSARALVTTSLQAMAWVRGCPAAVGATGRQTHFPDSWGSIENEILSGAAMAGFLEAAADFPLSLEPAPWEQSGTARLAVSGA